MAPASQTHLVNGESMTCKQPIQVQNSTQSLSKSQNSVEALRNEIEAKNSTEEDTQSQIIPVYAVPQKPGKKVLRSLIIN